MQTSFDPKDLSKAQQGVKLRLEGKPYSEIAKELDLPNTAGLRDTINKAIRNSQAEITADVELVMALDLARYEMIFEAASKFGLQGSHQHLNIMLKVLKDRREALAQLLELQKGMNGDDSYVDEVVTQVFRADSPEFIRAAAAISTEEYEKELEEKEEKKTQDPRKKRLHPGDMVQPNEDLLKTIPVEEREHLRSALNDLLLNPDLVPDDDEDDLED